MYSLGLLQLEAKGINVKQRGILSTITVLPPLAPSECPVFQNVLEVRQDFLMFRAGQLSSVGSSLVLLQTRILVVIKNLPEEGIGEDYIVSKLS